MRVLPARRGFCPRVWAPMESGDGLIVRVHPPSRGLEAARLRALARLSREHGNGQLELTRRANLQLRGVTTATLPVLQAELVRLGLTAATPAQELRQVLLVNPLSGLDPACAQLQELAQQIEHTLASLDPEVELPAKFGILLDSGGSVFRGVAADIFVEVRPENASITYLSVGADAGGRLALGGCRSVDLHAALLRLIALLGRETRMREVVAVRGVQAVRAAVQGLLIAFDVPPACERRAPLIGFQRGLIDWFGVAVPFGSGEPEQWQAIAQLSEDFGSAEVRVTPGRALLLPGVRAEDSAQLGALARQSGLIVDADDPLLRVIACPGAPACRSAWGETRAFARSLCEALPRMNVPESAREQDRNAGATLHVSGCSKSCASQSPADITIVHDADGCKLGFGTDAIQTARFCATSIDSVLQRLKETASARR